MFYSVCCFANYLGRRRRCELEELLLGRKLGVLGPTFPKVVLPRPITAELCNLPPEAKPINATLLLAADDPHPTSNKTEATPVKSVQGNSGTASTKVNTVDEGEKEICRCGCYDCGCCGCEWCRGRGGGFGTSKQMAMNTPELTHLLGGTSTETMTAESAEKSTVLPARTLSPLKKEALQAIVDTIKGQRNDAHQNGAVTQKRQARVYSRYSTMRRPMPPRVAPIMRFIGPPRAKSGRTDG